MALIIGIFVVGEKERKKWEKCTLWW